MNKLPLHELYSFFFCFVRILGVFLVFPMFSQRVIFSRAKVILAALIALFIVPLVDEFMPKTATMGYNTFLFYLFIEFGIGLLIGFSGYFLFMVLDFIGHIMGVESGLSNAQIFNPSMGESTHLTTTILTVSATVLLFVGNFHHTLIHVIINSYEHINFNSLNFINDFYTTFLSGVRKMFLIGLQFSFPFILIGIILNFCIGIINKLIPQIHIFSIMPPAQLLMFFIMLVATLTSITDGFLREYQNIYFDIFS